MEENYYTKRVRKAIQTLKHALALPMSKSRNSLLKSSATFETAPIIAPTWLVKYLGK